MVLPWADIHLFILEGSSSMAACITPQEGIPPPQNIHVAVKTFQLFPQLKIKVPDKEAN